MGCRNDEDCDANQYCSYLGNCLDEEVSECSGWDQCDLDMVDYVCGGYVDGCGSYFDCGTCGPGACTDGGRDCACGLDSFDGGASNDRSQDATDLGEFTDAPNSFGAFENLSIHSDDDEDWFLVTVLDKGVDGNPNIELSLTPHLPGDELEDSSVYRLSMWMFCLNGNSQNSVCQSGENLGESSDGIGCQLEVDGSTETLLGQFNCGGTIDESGFLLIHVEKTERYGRCDSYSLSLSVK
ncbi:MAG: hypothetical protein KC561_05350 [Myxococcales bacterium]|nr:hypothetical protein [Myxococcales bacterium]